MTNKTKDNETMYKPALELLENIILGPSGFQVDMDGLTRAQVYLLCSVVVLPTAKHWGFIALKRFAQLTNRGRR